MGYEGEDNERLEFLGDAVLDLINAEILFEDEDLNESEMTELRKLYVSNEQLAVIFDVLQMDRFVRTANNLKLTTKIKAGFVEAFFGALYLKKSYNESYQVWQRIQDKISFNQESDGGLYLSSDWYKNQDIYKLKNPKTTLQEFCQNIQFELPKYQVIKRKGPEHDPVYTVKLIIRPGSNKLGFENVFETYITDKPYVTEYGIGRNIKLAEKRTAEKMCDRIGLTYTSKEY